MTVKDTALDALKRSAKAILRDELRTLRLRARTAEAMHKTCMSNASKAHERVRLLESELHRREAELNTMRQEFVVMQAWGAAHRPGDLAFRCWSEHLGRNRGIGMGYYVDPFSRWGLPKP